jgi:hypothetical protein
MDKSREIRLYFEKFYIDADQLISETNEILEGRSLQDCIYTFKRNYKGDWDKLAIFLNEADAKAIGAKWVSLLGDDVYYYNEIRVHIVKFYPKINGRPMPFGADYHPDAAISTGIEELSNFEEYFRKHPRIYLLDTGRGETLHVTR